MPFSSLLVRNFVSSSSLIGPSGAPDVPAVFSEAAVPTARAAPEVAAAENASAVPAAAKAAAAPAPFVPREPAGNSAIFSAGVPSIASPLSLSKLSSPNGCCCVTATASSPEPSLRPPRSAASVCLRRTLSNIAGSIDCSASSPSVPLVSPPAGAVLFAVFSAAAGASSISVSGRPNILGTRFLRFSRGEVASSEVFSLDMSIACLPRGAAAPSAFMPPAPA